MNEATTVCGTAAVCSTAALGCANRVHRRGRLCYTSKHGRQRTSRYAAFCSRADDAGRHSRRGRMSGNNDITRYVGLGASFWRASCVPGGYDGKVGRAKCRPNVGETHCITARGRANHVATFFSGCSGYGASGSRVFLLPALGSGERLDPRDHGRPTRPDASLVRAGRDGPRSGAAPRSGSLQGDPLRADR